MKTSIVNKLASVCLALAAGVSISQAETYIWDPMSDGGSGGNGTWDLNTTANWFGPLGDVNWTDNSASGKDSAVFTGSAGTVTLNDSLSASNLTYLVGGYTISGTGTLTLGAGGIDASTTYGITTIGVPLTLAQGQQAWQIGFSGTLALDGTISRDVGAAVDFTVPGVTSSSLTNDATGIIGGWATVGAYSGGAGDWAAIDGSGNVTNYAGYTVVSDTGNSSPNLTGAASQNWLAGDPTGANNYVTTITNTTSLHSLVQQGDVTVNSGVTLTLGTGGLILRGASRWMIAGSSTTSILTSGSSTGELFVHAPNTGATDYRIWPLIADNGATPVTLVKNGAGYAALANNFNTYSGGTIVNAGQLAYSGVHSAPAVVSPFGAGTVTVNGGMVRLGVVGVVSDAFGEYDYTNDFVLNGGVVYGNDAFHFLKGNLTVASNGGALGATYDNKGDALNNGYAKGLFIDGTVTGTGTLTIQHSGLEIVNPWDSSVVYFRNMGTAAQNTYSGTVSVTPWASMGGSYLYLIGTNALANATIDVTGDNDATSGRFGAPALLFGSGTNLDGIGYATIGGLSGSGDFPLANTLVVRTGSSIGAPFALSVGNNNSDTTYYGIISGAGSLTKVGSGKLTLAGLNTYTGDTTINGGTLAVSGAIVSTNILIGNGGVFDVSPNGSLTLAGNQSLYSDGTVNGSIYTSPGTQIYAGTDGGYGTNTFNNDLTLDSAAAIHLDLGTQQNGSNDLVSVGGTLYANNNVIQLKAPSTSDSLEAADYVLFKSATAISGSFASAPTWEVAPVNAAHYSIVTGPNTVTLHYSSVAGPSGVGSASPSIAVRNQTVLLTVEAVNGTAGTVNDVTVDASAIGGSATLALADSGGNVWTNTITVSADTLAGAKTLVATLTDSAALSGLVNIPLTVAAGNDVWNGAGPDSNFSSNLNWTNQTAPGYVGDSLEFAGSTRLTPNMDNNYTATGLTFDDGASSFTIGTGNSSTLTLDGGLTNNSANPQTLNVPVALSAAQTLDAAPGDIALGGVISGAGSITKTGAGTLSLSATGNSLDGNVRVIGGTLNIPGGSTAFTGTSRSDVGYRTNSGNLTISGGSLTNGGDLGVGYSDRNGPDYNAVGTVTVANSTVSLGGRLIVGRGNNNQNTVSGTVTLNSGGTLSSEGDVLLGFAGNNNLGKVVVNGGTLNVATVTKRWVILSQWDTARSEIDINGGQMNLNENTDIRFAISGNNGTNTFNLNGGAVTFYADNATTVGGSGVVDLHQGNGISCVNTFNLNGGTLTVSGVTSANSSGYRAFNFNGGTLKAVADSSPFLNLGTNNAVANVRSGGAIIDDGGFYIVIDQPLLHSSLAGDNAFDDGGLTKLGTNTLTLSGASTYNGATLINAGTLALSGSGSINSSTNIMTAAGAIFDVSGVIYTNSHAMSGYGNVNGSVSAASGARIYGGTDGTYGTNTFNNDLTLASDAACYLDLGTSATGDNDQIVVDGTLTADGNYIHVKAPGSATSLDAADYVLITSANPISGTFATAPVWDVAPVNAGHYSVVTSGTSVTLHYNAAASGPVITSTSASPSTMLRNQTTLLSVTVLPGDAAISSVTVDLSPVGGSSVSLVQSNSTTTYTNSITVPATVAASTPSLTVIATDGASLSGAAGISLTVNASTEVWSGVGADQNWTTNPNWVSGSAPGFVGDGIAFAGSAGLTPNMDNNYSVTGLTFSNSASGFTIGSDNGSTLTITANGVVNNSASGQMVNVPVVFSEFPAINASAGDITLGQTVDCGSGALAVSGAHDTTISGAVSGTAGLTKAGAGALTLNGANPLSGATTIGGGTLNLAGTITNTELSTVGGASGISVLNIVGGTFLAAYNPANVWNSSLQVGAVSGAVGEIQMSSGTLVVSKQLAIGNANYGAYDQSGGDTTIGGFIALGATANGGVFNQSGGTVNMTNAPVTIGYASTASRAVMNLSGNAVFTLMGANGLWPGEVGTGVFNLSGNAVLAITNDGIVLGRGNAAGNGTVNLLGGMASVSSVSKGSGSGTFNFNGGTLMATTNNASFVSGLTAAYIYSGGAVIDDGGFTDGISQALLAPDGYGVISIPMSNGGSGYIAPPVVTITNISASGSGATAVANVSGGAITSITVTCPGHGYASGDTLGVSLTGGGGSGAVIGTPILGVNTSGGLTKLGAGTLTLSEANTYAGDTTVSAGTLELSQPTLNTNSTVTVASGAVLKLDFSVTNRVANLVLDGVTQAPGVYDSTTGSPYITGTGSLLVPSSIGPSEPAYLTNSISGSTLTLSWPADQGWMLQMQTNGLSDGLGTNWVDVPGSSTMSSTNITIDPTMPTKFYRLKY